MTRKQPLDAITRERANYIKRQRRGRMLVRVAQLGFLAAFLLLWELLAQLKIIDSFMMSCPSRIVKTLFNLSGNGLLNHLGVTVSETLIGFGLGVTIGVALAILLWWSAFLSKAAEPFLVILNALPKIALGPIIILWAGAGMRAIIVMAIAISLIVTVMEMLNGFKATSPAMMKMARTFNASKLQIFTKIVFPSNLQTLFNSLKVNIGLSLVGVIAGEFLVSKAGLGYLIVYGGQVFKLDLVMASVIVLAVLAAVLYKSVSAMERVVVKSAYHTK